MRSPFPSVSAPCYQCKVDDKTLMNIRSMEPLPREMAHNSRPPSTNQFRFAHFILKIIFTFNTKQGTSIRRSTVLSLSLQLVFLAPHKTFVLAGVFGAKATGEPAMLFGVSSLLAIRSQSYKTFYGCKLQIFIISQSVCSCEAFPLQCKVCW